MNVTLASVTIPKKNEQTAEFSQIEESVSTELQSVLADPLLLAEIDDLDELVPQIPLQPFFSLANHLQEEGRLDLLIPYATPAQLTSLFDLGAWTQDRLAIDKVREWMTVIVDAYEGADKPRGELSALIREMDPELWTYALVPGTTIFDLDPENDELLEQAHRSLEEFYTYQTPDGLFLVAVPDHQVGRQAAHILSKIYQDSLKNGRMLVNAARAALPSQLEEDLYRWRSGRMAELGFVEWDEAIKLLRPLDAKTIAQQDESLPLAIPPSSPETSMLRFPWLQSGLLSKVLAHLDAKQLGIRTREFLLLTNELMAAQRFDAGDHKLQERAAIQTQRTINLGLDMLSRFAPAEVEVEAFLAERMQAVGLRSIFRVGYGALDKLRKATLTLHRQGRISIHHVGSLLDRPWGPVLQNLARTFPEWTLFSTGIRTRPFEQLAEIGEATLYVAQAAALAKLAFAEKGYRIDPAWVTRLDEPRRVVIGDLIRTAVICTHSPGFARGMFAPLTQDDLRWAKTNLLRDGKLLASVREEFFHRCADIEAEEHGEGLAANLLLRLEVELAALEETSPGEFDLQKLGGLVTVQNVSVWLKTGLVAEA